jgi:hypothetical protein
MEVQMKEIFTPLIISMLIVSLAGCSLLTTVDNKPTPIPPTPAVPPSGYEPQSGDSKLKRDNVFLEIENSSLLVMESYPIQVNTILNGTLSDPCHQLRVVVEPANNDNQINLEVYSVVDPSTACIMVIKPFSATIPLGSFTDGHYTVYANGELLGEFDA